MSELVIALLMIINGEIKEHRIQESMSMCLKGKREATRQLSDNIEYKCIKTKAELKTNLDGTQYITKIILK